MKTTLTIATCLLVLAVSGCSSMPKVINALKNDPASIKFDVVSYGTTVHFERSFPTNWAPVPKQAKPSE